MNILDGKTLKLASYRVTKFDFYESFLNTNAFLSLKEFFMLYKDISSKLAS